MFLFLLVATGVAAEDAHYASRPNWMEQLEDDTPVCRVCIPGVHDGGTGSVHIYGASVQTKDLKELFDAGVRAFDLRVGFTNGIEMRIYHGGVDMSYRFAVAMNELYEKLKENDSEFVIVIVNIESATTQKDNCKEHLSSYFRPTYNSGAKVTHDYWSKESDYNAAKARWMVFKPDMKVSEARGKVILMFRDDYESIENIPGIRLCGFGSSPSEGQCSYYDQEAKSKKTFPMITQDAYQKDDIEKSLDAKFINYVRPTMQMFTDKIKQEPNNYVWCINHLSGYTNDPSAPNSAILARAVNRQFNQFVVGNRDIYTGIVMMDYAAETTSWGYTVAGDLALDAIIHQNYRYWKKLEKEDGSIDNIGHYESTSN